MREVVQGRELQIYLPPSYFESGDRYPVVYLQDGGDVAKGCLDVLEQEFQSKELPEVILVGIVTQNRLDEYTPWPAPALNPRFANFGGCGAAYVAELVERVKPFVDTSYRTKRDAEHTGIMGASLGALIAIYAAYQNPQVFGRIGSLSASLWYEGMLGFLREAPLPVSAQKWFLYVGSLEGADKNNSQQKMVPNTREAHQILREKGILSRDLRLEIAEGATHGAYFFEKWFPEALKWLMGGKST